MRRETLGRLPLHPTMTLLRAVQQGRHPVDGKGRAHLLGVSVTVRGLRLATFAQAAVCRCSACGVPAWDFAVQRDLDDAGTPITGWHLQLYGRHTNGTLVAFTHDHTLARCLGGKNHPSNTTVMCAPCNRAKAVGEHRTFLQREALADGTGADRSLPTLSQQARLEAQWMRMCAHHGHDSAAHRAYCEAAAALRRRSLNTRRSNRPAPAHTVWDRPARHLGLSVLGYRFFVHDHNRTMQAIRAKAAGLDPSMEAREALAPMA